MKFDVLMPKMGESITEGRILKWLKQPGDHVDKDESLLEIATDKVDTDVPSPAAGTVVSHLAAEGDTVEVGFVISIIDTEGGSGAGVTKETSPAPVDSVKIVPADGETETKQPGMHEPQTMQHAHAMEHGKRFFSPVVKRIADVEGIPLEELAFIPGSGTGGRLTKQDIQSYINTRKTQSSQIDSLRGGKEKTEGSPIIQSRPFAFTEAVERIPMDNMQRMMAEHMLKSMQASPHVTVVSEVDMTRIVKFRNQHADSFKSREGISLTFMPFIAQAVLRALKDYPLVNASIDGTDILVKRALNLGIAVAMEEGGLIVPVVKNAENLTFRDLALSIADVAGRARKKRLQIDEIQDGTFTLTNFGVFGNLFGTPIINQPQVAILGIGAITKRPVVTEHNGEDAIVIRSMMYLSLSFDHRIVDGALGGSFLERVVSYLESFENTGL